MTVSDVSSSDLARPLPGGPFFVASVNTGMDWDNILDDLIGELNPEFVPNEYIIAIKYTDKYSLEHIVRGNNLRFFLRNPEQFGARAVQVVLDISRIRRVMYNAIAAFFL
jgi:hypothetical protein